jgi:arylsulfatase A-like enzyme
VPHKLLHARWPWLAAAFVALGILLFQFLELRDGDPRPSGNAEDVEALAQRDDVNLVFILIDTLRAHRLGAYGYPRDTSPSLDYLAESGVRFDRHLAQSSWTKCSMASLWTGLNPDRTGVLRFDDALPQEAVMPAEIFRDAGFHTAGVFRNGWVASNFGFSQGFELYDRPAPDIAPASVRRDNPHTKLDGTDRAVIDSAVEFLRVQGDERFFLYLHLMDVHQYLYDSRSALFGTTYSDVYDNSVRHEDGMVGRLLVYLSKSGLLERTVVVIASDHGEAFLERGYDGHAKHVYRESTEVPFILSLPFRLDGGSVISQRTRNIDVWPTLLDLFGLPPLREADGRSLLPAILADLRGGAAPEDEWVGTAYLDRSWGKPTHDPLPALAVAQGGFRFIHSATADGEPIEQLFDASDDPEESVDVLESAPEVAQALRERAAAFLTPKPTPWGVAPVKVEIDEMQLNQLRALGYVIP